MKNKIIKLFNLLIYPLTFNIFFKKIISNDFIVLLYHDVSDKPSAFHRTENLYVSKKKFKDQILFLKKYYKFINPKNIKEKINQLHLLLSMMEHTVTLKMQFLF